MNRSNLKDEQNREKAAVHVENPVKRYHDSEMTAVDGISFDEKRECVQ